MRLLCRRHFDQSCEWTVFRLFLSNFKQLRRPALEHLVSVDWQLVGDGIAPNLSQEIGLETGGILQRVVAYFDNACPTGRSYLIVVASPYGLAGR